MTQLLPKNYEIPKAPSNYMKFQKGLNKFRILSPAIIGYEYWNTENKPIRSKERFEFIPENIRLEDGMPTDIKHFWAFIVWNYQESSIQILEITQATIQQGIKLGVDLREGNATNNDIGVIKSGDGFNTEYKVQFSDPSPVTKEIETAFKAKPITLEALYTGEDPFKSGVPTERAEDPHIGEVDVENMPF